MARRYACPVTLFLLITSFNRPFLHHFDSMASSSRLPQIYSRFLRLSSSWPIDPLRPKVSFGEAIRINIGKALLTTPPTPTPPIPSGKNGSPPTPGVTGEPHKDVESLSYKKLTEDEIQYAERAADALEGLRTGRETKDVSKDGGDQEAKQEPSRLHLCNLYLSQHPMSESILRPKSDPVYYERLRKGIEKAAQGDPLKPSFANRVRIFFGAKPL